MGVVLNRPTETVVAEAVPELADLADPEDVIHAGGPVAPDAVIALGDFEEPDEAGTPVAGSLGLVDPERADPALRRLRVFAGYAGWAPGQLDQELEAEAWIVGPVGDGRPLHRRGPVARRPTAQGRRLRAAGNDAGGSDAELGPRVRRRPALLPDEFCVSGLG